LAVKDRTAAYNRIYTTIKTTSEFKNVSVTVDVVDGLELHRSRPELETVNK